MAQRKSPASAGKTAPGSKSSAGRSGSGSSGAARTPGTPPRKKPKSIVNQKQTPWGLIITAVVIVLFAAGVVAVVISTKKSDDASAASSKGGQTVDASDPYRQPELAAAAAIEGVTYRVEGEHTHVAGKIKYDTTPPIGGNHSQYWADCAGTVYDKPIANENAVHMLEHGAIWITYNASKITGSQLDTLKKYAAGVDRMAMSPYPDLSSPISLQAWGYQLKVDSASDPRIAKFISVLKNNQKTTPEYGSTCSQPTFKSSPSTFGNPKDTP